MRWGVWLGAAALLLAGVFLIRYAVEQGFLGPAIRCTLAACLGVALLAGAEFLRRKEVPRPAGPFSIDQGPPGLAAGGVAVLLGAAYGAGPFYGLLPPLVSFAALAAASATGLAASLRFGQLTAAVGLAGAFITPALVATQSPSLPGLFAYLFSVSVAALWVVRRTAWVWLGWASVTAGAVWVCVAALTPSPDHWAAAAFVPAAVLLNLALIPAEALANAMGRRLVWLSCSILPAAGLVLEAIDDGIFLRVALLLLSPIAVWKGRAEPRLDRLPWLAALVGMLALLFWTLAGWTPLPGPAAGVDLLQALPDGTLAPQVVRPLLIAAALFAAFNAAAGLMMEQAAPVPVRWAALATATPVLTLAITYALTKRFQIDGVWAMTALALAAALVAAASRARRRAPDLPETQCAGAYAGGAMAALALGCAMLLHDQWLTLAVALLLPGLPWIEARADLPPIRHVALALAALVLLRSLLNWNVASYNLGTTPFLNGLIPVYAGPALAFALAAAQFRRRRDDLLVAVLEAGAATLGSCFLALELHHSFGHGRLTASFGFGEVSVQLLAIASEATALLYINERARRPTLRAAGYVLGACGLTLGSALLVLNPSLTGASAGAFSLAAAYLAPALFAAAARRCVSDPSLRVLLLVYAVVSGFVWLTLQVRVAFNPAGIGFKVSPLQDAEMWAWSGAWLVYGSILIALGIYKADRLLRMLALAVIALVCAKVFLIDMGQLTGLWRVLSFLGLGVGLIGLGIMHRRLVLPRST